MGLLLAAAFGIGLIGVAAVAGGWFERNPDGKPGPSTLAVVPPAVTATPQNPPQLSPPGNLPTLQDLIHAGPVDNVVLAQASGPAEAALMPDRFVTHSSTVDLGLVPVGRMDVELGCLTKDGADEAHFGMVTNGLPPPDSPADVLGCEGSILHATYTVDEPSVLRLVLPGAASWRVVVRAADGLPGAPAGTPTKLFAGAGEEVLIDKSFQPVDKDPVPQPSYDPSFGTGSLGLPVLAGEIQFRDRYLIRASCSGSPAMAYHVGSFDPSGPSVPDSTTYVACDGDLHEMVWRPGARPSPDVFVSAPQGTAWRLLVTADPAPIGIAKDDGGWTAMISSGPRFGADDLNEMLVGRLTGKNTLARIVISCQGGTSVDVSVSRGDQTGDLQSFTANCGDQPVTIVGDPIVPDESGELSVEVDPHGRMWTAVTIQQAPASAAR